MAPPALLDTHSTPSPHSQSHLHQNILALAREQVLESIEGEVMGHTNSRASGVTHAVRAIPPPVAADTRESDQVLLVHTLGTRGSIRP